MLSVWSWPKALRAGQRGVRSTPSGSTSMIRKSGTRINGGEHWSSWGTPIQLGSKSTLVMDSHIFGVAVNTLFSAWFIIAWESNALQLPLAIYDTLCRLFFVKNFKAHDCDAEPAITQAYTGLRQCTQGRRNIYGYRYCPVRPA